MAAKRIGSVLTNVTGTAGQLLRVKSDESGFEFYTPATIPAYTITNDATDRIIDAADTNIDELANVLSTLIKDITTVVGGPVAFQWSASEQIWPFEKAVDGSVLYCKEVDCGAMPNNGTKSVAHNIASFPYTKVHRLENIIWNPSGADVRTFADAGSGQFQGYIYLDDNNINVRTLQDWTFQNLKVRIIYAK
jgi:hypothetical protein